MAIAIEGLVLYGGPFGQVDCRGMSGAGGEGGRGVRDLRFGFWYCTGRSGRGGGILSVVQNASIHAKFNSHPFQTPSRDNHVNHVYSTCTCICLY